MIHHLPCFGENTEVTAHGGAYVDKGTVAVLAKWLPNLFLWSPLTSLMKDQVAKFSERGLACTFVGEQKDTTTILFTP